MKATDRSKGINYAIRQILLPAAELERKGAKLIKMHIGDPNKWDFETPAHVRAALCAAVEDIDNGYEDSEGMEALREAIVVSEREKNGISIAPTDVIITNGVSEAIQVLIPTTWPSMFTSAPPEFPWLTAASVWM